MFSRILSKMKDYNVMQKIVVEIVGDLLILAMGLIGGYYVRVFLMR